MSFLDALFFPFLAMVLVAVVCVTGRARVIALTVFSYLFYAAAFPPYVFLLLGSSCLDYVLARGMRGKRGWTRRSLLLISLTSNLGLLATFKYADFLATQINTLGEAAGLGALVQAPGFLLPVGISFYTFQTLSYTIDVYRGQMRPARDPWDFFLYVSFFPQLVAGPIIRASHFLPQIKAHRPLVEAGTLAGIELILIGFFKKAVIADNLAPFVDPVFNAPQAYSVGAYYLATIFFSVQIYCDFSGYSDIARGLARVLGFHVPLNFRAPYLSGSIITFWRRWHISLSLWLRDYLYIPLGGNRRGRWRTLINALITWILGGLWHGAAWQFIVWGLWHGLLVGVAQTLRGTRTGGMYRRMFFPAQVLLTFVLVTIGWVFFRAPDLTTGVTMLGAMAGLPGISGPQPADPLALYALALLGVVAMCHVALYRQLDRIEAQGLVLQRVSVPARIGLISLSTFIIILFSGPTQTFIYFQF